MRFEADLAIAAAFLEAAQEVRNQRQRMTDARSDGTLSADEEWLATVCDAMADRIARMAEANARERLASLLDATHKAALHAAAGVILRNEATESGAGAAIRPRRQGEESGMGYIRAILALEILPEPTAAEIDAVDAAPTLP